jgi:hypothetical protein
MNVIKVAVRSCCQNCGVGPWEGPFLVSSLDEAPEATNWGTCVCPDGYTEKKLLDNAYKELEKRCK